MYGGVFFEARFYGVHFIPSVVYDIRGSATGSVQTRVWVWLWRKALGKFSLGTNYYVIYLHGRRRNVVRCDRSVRHNRFLSWKCHTFYIFLLLGLLNVIHNFPARQWTHDDTLSQTWTNNLSLVFILFRR